MVALGAPLVLHCYAIGWPVPDVTWWRGNAMLPFSSGLFEQRRDFSLLIKSVTLTTLGPYVCQAYNGYGKAGSGTIIVQATGVVTSSSPEEQPFLQYLVNPPQKPETPYQPWLTYKPPTTHAPTTETTHAPTKPTYPITPRTELNTQPTARVFIG